MKKFLLFNQEILFKNRLSLKQEFYLNFKLNLKLINFKKLDFLKITSNFNLILLKKNYYNLINSYFFFSQLMLSKSKLTFNKKNIKFNKLTKNSLTNFTFNNQFLFFFIFFILKKNLQKQTLILKKLKLRFKKKPKINLFYFKLLKDINYYNNQSLKKVYGLDWETNLILILKKIPFLTSNLLFLFNFIKLLKL